jgi:hypothetical protein
MGTYNVFFEKGRGTHLHEGAYIIVFFRNGANLENYSTSDRCHSRI